MYIMFYILNWSIELVFNSSSILFDQYNKSMTQMDEDVGLCDMINFTNA